MHFNFAEESRSLSCLNVRVGLYPAGIHRLVDNRLIAPETLFLKINIAIAGPMIYTAPYIML